jgi:dUTP pyrophosphatase
MQTSLSQLEVEILQIDKELPLPGYAYQGDAGCDLFSRVDLTVKPGERVLVPTGIAIAMPDGYAGFVQPRSGLASKNGITVLNTPGLIDSHYRGEICVILINLDLGKNFEIKKGHKVAQLVIQKVENVIFRVVDKLNSTERGTGGFGSSGR